MLEQTILKLEPYIEPEKKNNSNYWEKICKEVEGNKCAEKTEIESIKIEDTLTFSNPNNVTFTSNGYMTWYYMPPITTTTTASYYNSYDINFTTSYSNGTNFIVNAVYF